MLLMRQSAQAAILFHVAGEKWTVPSVGWENTSLSLFAGDWEACANNVKRIYGAVDRLRPKMVVGTECGHAHRATVVEGPYWAGREDGKPPVPFLHYVEWLADALRKGDEEEAAALLALAFTVGGTSIWFAPLISESVCLVVAAVFLRRFWRSPGDLADEQR